MEQPTILTDAEVGRLNQIRASHSNPVEHTDRDSPATLLGTLKIRHRQRGELLNLVDKLLAGVSGLKHNDVGWANAHHFAAMVDHLSAENAKLKTDNGEFRLRNQALNEHLAGMNKVQCNMQADLSNALKELAQANGRDRQLSVIKFSDHARYNVEVKPEDYQAEFKPGLGTVVTHVPAKIMNLAVLVERYNEVVAAVADNGEG